jgi:hypothetical protein
MTYSWYFANEKHVNKVTLRDNIPYYIQEWVIGGPLVQVHRVSMEDVITRYPEIETSLRQKEDDAKRAIESLRSYNEEREMRSGKRELYSSLDRKVIQGTLTHEEYREEVEKLDVLYQ